MPARALSPASVLRGWLTVKVTRVALSAVAAVVLVALPLGLSSYTVQLVAVALLYAVVAISLDLAWGYAGILSMGQAVYFGTGALGVGVFVTRVSSAGAVIRVSDDPLIYLAGLVAGVTAAALIAAVVGALAFSAGGSSQFYIAVVSLALTLIATTSYNQAKGFTGGDNGLSGFALYEIGNQAWYWIALAALALVAGLAYAVVRSDFGVLMRAIRDNERRCLHLGFDVPLVKLGILVAGAMIAALAGGLYACYVGFVSAPLFGFLFSTDILIWTAVGGRGTLWGPALGAIVVSIAGSQLSAALPFVWPLVIGLIFIAVVLVIPDGLFPGAIGLIHALSRSKATAGPIGSPVEKKSGCSIAASSTAEACHQGSEEGTVLAIEGLRRSFGNLEVLRGVSLEAKKGELLCIIGPNGAGKTTLLSSLSDARLPYQGQIRMNHKGSLRGIGPERLVRLGIARKFQAPNLFDTLTVSETLLLASRCGRVPSPWRRTTKLEVTPEVHEICRVTGLLERANVLAKDLPHGLKQGLELAATVALRPEILLLDEPTAGLTAGERKVIGGVLREVVEQRHITVLLIEHDLEFVRSIADRVAVLHDGRVLFVGTPEEASNSELVKEVYVGQ